MEACPNRKQAQLSDCRGVVLFTPFLTIPTSSLLIRSAHVLDHNDARLIFASWAASAAPSHARFNSVLEILQYVANIALRMIIPFQNAALCQVVLDVGSERNLFDISTRLADIRSVPLV